MWETYFTPDSIEAALRILTAHKSEARIIAGATDLMLELERGQQPDTKILIDISRIPGLDHIRLEDGHVHLGPLVSHNHVAGSGLVRSAGYALARACWKVGSPQIRNRGTVAGNVITASPANDTITPLMALGAIVHLKSLHAERAIPLQSFYTGVRRNVMEADELLVDISFPAQGENGRSGFLKLALRRAQAISLVNAAVALEFDGETIRTAAITLGAVTPTIIHVTEAETLLVGKTLTPEVIEAAAQCAQSAARPIDDVRATANYRRLMAAVSVKKILRSIAAGTEKEGHPEDPVMLWGTEAPHVTAASDTAQHSTGDPIEITINGQSHRFTSGHDKSLLRLLREEGGFTGTKEGCAEGECGACTVHLDGVAVMSCLIPAPRAHGCEVETIEGLGDSENLHPLQKAFVEEGAVQCGYCTPGVLMSSAKLLEERPQPSREEIKAAITGNLCRCTGYYKIITAVEKAAENKSA